MAAFIEREIEASVAKWIDAKEILAIRGPRQSGKTTLLYKLRDALLKKGKDVHYITFEDDIEKEKFEKDPRGYVSYHLGEGKKKHYFLFDEVQYIKEAGKLLKLVYDTLDNVKLIITGSSTLDMNDVGSFLVGRVIFFELYPFSFSEFLLARDNSLYHYYKKNRFNLKKPKKVSTLFLDKGNALLKEYIMYGGYPRIVLERDAEKKKVLLKNLFLTYIEKDIVKAYGIKYKQKVIDLVRNLASLNGSIINYDELCSLTGLYLKELKGILGILEDTYTIRLIKPFHRNLTTELKKNPRIYFQDMGLRNFITERFVFSDDEFGKLLENFVLAMLREEKVNFWRTTAKAEVDFVVDGAIPVEVKATPKVTRSLRSFLETYRPKIAVIVTLTAYTKATLGNTVIYTVPAALW